MQEPPWATPTVTYPSPNEELNPPAAVLNPRGPEGWGQSAETRWREAPSRSSVLGSTDPGKVKFQASHNA